MDTLDKLTIDTPEQTSLEFPLAGIGSRFLAMVVDTTSDKVKKAQDGVLEFLLAACKFIERHIVRFD